MRFETQSDQMRRHGEPDAGAAARQEASVAPERPPEARSGGAELHEGASPQASDRVELRGIEPLASTVRLSRSTN